MIEVVWYWVAGTITFALIALYQWARKTEYRDEVYAAHLEADKYRRQAASWRARAELPDAEEHRQPLTEEEMERREDVVLEAAERARII